MPISGSSNPVTSGGVYEAIAAIEAGSNTYSDVITLTGVIEGLPQDDEETDVANAVAILEDI